MGWGGEGRVFERGYWANWSRVCIQTSTHSPIPNSAGFVEVKEVTQALACVPDLLVWGGEGTRMDMPVAEFLRRWRPMILSRGVEFKGGYG